MTISNFSSSNEVSGTDTFQSWINKTNNLSDLVETRIVTASTSGTDTTTGNVKIAGELTGTTVKVTTSLQAESGTLNIDSPVTIDPGGTGNFNVVSSVNSSLLGTLVLSSGTKTTTINSGTTTVNGSNLVVNANTAFNGTTTTVGGTLSAAVAVLGNTTVSGGLSVNTGDMAISSDLSATGLVDFDGADQVIIPTESSSTKPSSPTQGSILYNTSRGSFEGYNGSTWLSMSGMKVSSTPPAGAGQGDLWLETDSGIVWIYGIVSNTWTQIARDNNTNTHVHTRTRLDTNSVAHETIETYSDGVLVSIQCSDAAWTPKSTEYAEGSTTLASKFPTVTPGVQLRNDSNYRFTGTATSAQYADVAERYASDKPYDHGTVVRLGGSHEITETTTQGDTEVFGVISTNPALEMNAGAGSDETHPFVAMTGRVPCKVVGKVTKGQRLITSAVPGHAMAATDVSDYRLVIGRALETKTTEGEGVIEVVVGAK